MNTFSPIIPPRSDLDWCWYLRRQGRTGEALERALHDIGVMQPGGWADWQDSSMTDIGAPVEMLFSADQSTMSLRTEVDDPGNDPQGRLETACHQIAKLGGKAPPEAWRYMVSAAQCAADLRFGAWLGLHQSDSDLGMTLFAEIPEAAADLSALFTQALPKDALAFEQDDLWLNRIGYATLTGQTTLYFETRLSAARIVPQLAQIAKVSSEPMLRDINAMIDAGIPNAHVPETFGFSFALHADGTPPTLTLHISAKALFVTDQEIEERVRAYPGDHVKAYAGLADQLLPAPEGQTHHGLIGLQARGEIKPLLSIGVAAPWISHDGTA